MKKVLFSILSILFVAFSGIAQDYDVSSSSKTFRDASRRNRRVNARIYYPNISRENRSEINFPVIILGHGFVMGSDAYENFYDTLVPRGYIVVFVNTEGSFFANHDAYSKDLAFMVAAIQAENNNSGSVLSGIVDDKTALIGHSMGGGAATVAASMVEVETLVTFAPALLRFDTLTPASNVSEDAIVFSGTADGVTPPDEHHIPIYSNLGSSCKYLINITGGAHCYYANSNFFCDFGENSSSGDIQITRAQQQATTFQFLNSWLDYKLKGNTNAQQSFLIDLATSGDITSENTCDNPQVTYEPETVAIQTFPNPTNKLLNIKIANDYELSKVEFYNQTGRLVHSSSTNQVDVSKLRPGHYLTKIYIGEATITKKVVIQR
ncbi:T9SS type A sorting domain-containing protein [Aquimarina sp. D1M17]|uniref:poly(ethylene terephthalate) hydrolase family protein n=1 Tax=Aquimarina acroporae TaxID=2937283 RepID=UPI0020BE9905|nr:T9SS type A sorting domain-containing protein [Aquimarina acroporae]MCK8523652.1 T9SS type A sorting domain-containing protein [Aquimarina acroporae]